MQTFQIPYGKAQLPFQLPDSIQVDWIDPVDLSDGVGKGDTIHAALDAPLGDRQPRHFRGARSVGIAINDKTRPVPHQVLLPPLLERLEELGLGPVVRFYIATGTHQPMPAEEFSRVVPETILARYPVVSHDCDDQENLAFLGETSRGTPIWVNREFYQSDLKIVVGTIEPHHFAGFSGGSKTAAIGLAGRQTIAANHAMLTDPLSRMGEFACNPLRQDIEEIGARMGVHFALNVRLNAHKEVLDTYFGDPARVLAAGIPAVRTATETAVEGAYDVVITSPGGHPKDINFYQAQKAITPAAMIAREGGTVILVAACPEGVGSQGYAAFMRGVTSMDGVPDKFREQGFSIGPHKALQVALIARRKRIIVMSEMPADVLRGLLLTPAASLEEALTLVDADLSSQMRIAILPHATNTLPVLAGEGSKS